MIFGSPIEGSFLLSGPGLLSLISFSQTVLLQNLKDQFRDRFDVVLDTIGLPETEAAGINLLRRGGQYMTLQVPCRLKTVLMFSLQNHMLMSLSIL